LNNLIEKYKGFIFDLDGTIYRGTHLIPDADKTVNHLKKLGKKVIFISNKTTGSVKDYYQFLSENGLEVAQEEIVNSTIVTKKYLKENFKGASFFAIGEKTFIEDIEEAGLHYSEDPGKINILVVTLDRTLNYEKLETAARALENGARFFAANIDDTCPVDDGEVLDAGATISALEKRTHKKLELHFGKPSHFMFEEIRSRIQTNPSDLLLVGDRLETDIAMGNKFGIDTALVDTGVRYFPNGLNGITPTYHINSVFDLLNYKV